MLFPTPVATVDNDFYLQDEHDVLINSEYEILPEHDFEQTQDNFILDTQAPNLRSWIQKQLDSFSENALATKQRLKITQSWCLKHSNQIQNVFIHSHCNSIVSGAYYVYADDASENIRFHKDLPFGAPSIKWEKDKDLLEKQKWMWEWEAVNVKTGRLILFPSYMYHSVIGQNINNNLRCVLSFNTWFNGPIGNTQKLTRLGAVQ